MPRECRRPGRCLHDAQLRPVLLRLQDRRLPPPSQVVKGRSLEQRLVELSTLKLARLEQWWVADDLPDPAAELDARRWQSLDRFVYGGRDC